MFTYNIFYKTAQHESAASYTSQIEIPAAEIDSIMLSIVIRKETPGSADTELFDSFITEELPELRTIQTVMNRYGLVHIAYECMGLWTNINRRMLFEKSVPQTMKAIALTSSRHP